MLQPYLISFAALILVFVIMGTALHFAQFKKRGGCCSDGIESGDKHQHKCSSCKCGKDK